MVVADSDSRRRYMPRGMHVSFAGHHRRRFELATLFLFRSFTVYSRLHNSVKVDGFFTLFAPICPIPSE